MNDTVKNGGGGEWSEEAYEAMRARVQDANINAQTLLATDYLNHFNEIVMTLEMIPMMPELLDDAKEWQPKSYQDHFRDSTFSDKDLAVEAYDLSPEKYRAPFETTISQLDRMVAGTLERIEKEITAERPELVELHASEGSQMIQKLMDHASAIIHGSAHVMDQDEIDSFLGD